MKDEGLLDSAIHSPLNTFYYNQNTDIYTLAYTAPPLPANPHTHQTTPLTPPSATHTAFLPPPPHLPHSTTPSKPTCQQTRHACLPLPRRATTSLPRIPFFAPPETWGSIPPPQPCLPPPPNSHQRPLF